MRSPKFLKFPLNYLIKRSSEEPHKPAQGFKNQPKSRFYYFSPFQKAPYDLYFRQTTVICH